MNGLYRKIRKEAMEDSLSVDTIFDLLNEYNFHEQSTQYPELYKILFRATVFHDISMSECYALITNCELYDYLVVKGVEVDCFMYALANYIYKKGQFKCKLSEDVEDLKADPQDAYNHLIRKIMRLLGVFYD